MILSAGKSESALLVETGINLDAEDKCEKCHSGRMIFLQPELNGFWDWLLYHYVYGSWYKSTSSAHDRPYLGCLTFTRVYIKAYTSSEASCIGSLLNNLPSPGGLKGHVLYKTGENTYTISRMY